MARRAQIIGEYELRCKVGSAFSRLGKSVKRAPADARHSLDRWMSFLIRSDADADAELIEEILDAVLEIFAPYSEHEFAKTALRVLGVRNSDETQIILLKTDYQGLGPPSRSSCEKALSLLVRGSTPISALVVFQALASAIDTNPPKGIPPDSGDLLVAYVAAVGELWRRVGLRTGRGNHPADRKYRSKFHRFVELVLTAIVEPSTSRHSGKIDDIARQIRDRHAKLSPEARSEFSPSLRRADREWLVSEHHVREALALLAQKKGRKTP
jgi:hypothetical protein